MSFNRERFRRDAEPLLERVNHFYAASGEYPFRGWVLLPRYEYDQIDKYSRTLQVEIDDSTQPDNIGTLKNLAIVQAQCVTRGIASDPDALYLIELTDGRGLVSNRWFDTPILEQYNIRAPAYPHGTYYTDSMDENGVPWTWATLLQNMWEHAEIMLGAWPGLPNGYSPPGSPEEFWFEGVAVWPQFNAILAHLGLSVAYDPASAAPYSIVASDAADSVLAALQARYANRLEEDREWIDVGAGRVPALVTVYFRRRNEFYGSEETVRRDSGQWSTSSIYQVSLGSADYPDSVGRHHIWSDYTVRYDKNGTVNDGDAVTASAIAQQLVTRYYNRIDPGGHLNQTYAGALPFTTGSMVDGVCWYMKNGGWRTQIVSGPCPPWPNIWE